MKGAKEIHTNIKENKVDITLTYSPQKTGYP